MRSKRRLIQFSDLESEHQYEVIGHLGREAAAKTVWELDSRFPADEAAAYADLIAIVVRDRHVREVMTAIEAGGGIRRPILIDDLDEDGPWMEGIHRTFAAIELGLKTVPALLRVK